MDSNPYLPPEVVEPAESGWRPRISVRKMMGIVFVLACASALMTMLAQKVEQAREAARRSCCSCNLCSIQLALHNYHSAYGVFPPAFIADASGKPMHSWRVLILGQMEQSAVYARYDFSEPWNGPNNIKLLPLMPNIYACPSRFDQSSRPASLTCYALITGPGTIFPGATSTKVADITDGPGNTLMIVEVENVNIPWTSPQDLDARTMSLRVNDPAGRGISSPHPGGANTVFADGKHAFLPDTVTPRQLKAMITIDGGEAIDVNEVLLGK
jgi:prepilin-type processing-associated H-X9-DG protein